MCVQVTNTFLLLPLHFLFSSHQASGLWKQKFIWTLIPTSNISLFDYTVSLQHKLCFPASRGGIETTTQGQLSTRIDATE